MSLVDEYHRQRTWRDWPTAFAALPPLHGTCVLDLGCAVGDQAADFVAHGARVIGYDANEELLAAARARHLANAEFRLGNLASPIDPGCAIDGVWASFAAAYFPDLPAVLPHWLLRLRPGGWIALTEVDDLFAHDPLDPRTRQHLDAYADEALLAKRYDFRMGRHLAQHLHRTGCRVTATLTLPDQELAFEGPARDDVLAAWSTRLDRMRLLQQRCGDDWPAVRRDFLDCLQRPDHRCRTRVVLCIAASLHR